MSVASMKKRRCRSKKVRGLYWICEKGISKIYKQIFHFIFRHFNITILYHTFVTQ